MNNRYLDKDPAAILTYSVNWSEWLQGSDFIANSTIVISTISGDPRPLTIVSTGIQTQSNVAFAEISGGSVGNTYTITNTITTRDGYVDARRFRIRVSERYL